MPMAAATLNTAAFPFHRRDRAFTIDPLPTDMIPLPG
jgi:hypothetical protein